MGGPPPAQAFIRSGDVAKDQPAFPLNTQVCLECGLIQVADQIPPDYFRHYLYVPSGAATMHTHFRGLAERSEEHTSELQSLMRISYAVFCLKKKTQRTRL